MAWKMFEFGGVGALGGGVLGVAGAIGAAIAAPVAAPVAGGIIFAGFIGAMVGGVGGVFTGSVFDVLEKDSEVIKVTEEKDARIAQVTKEKDTRITQIIKEKSDFEKNLEKTQKDHDELEKIVQEMKKTDIGTLYAEVKEQKLINKIFADRINTLENENQELRKEVSLLKKENQELKEKILNLENEKKQIEAKNLDLENRIEEFKIKLKNSENSRIDTIQKLATNVESLIMTSGNQLHFISKAMNSIAKSKDAVLNSLEVKQEFLNQNLSKEINTWFPSKNIQLRIQGLILLTEEFIKMEEPDVEKIKSKSYEIFCSSKHILANLADELRGLREQEFELTEKKPENNRISNDKAVLDLLDKWGVPTEFNVLLSPAHSFSNFNFSEVIDVINNQIAVNS